MSIEQPALTSRIVSWVLTGHGPASRPAPPERTPLEIPALRRWIGPALLLGTTPILVLVLWMICAHFDGSIVLFASSIDGGFYLQLRLQPSWEIGDE